MCLQISHCHQKAPIQKQKRSSSGLFLISGTEGQHRKEVGLIPVKWFITAAMHNTGSVTVVCRFPAVNLSSLFPGTSEFATSIPPKWFPSSPMHSFVLPEEKEGGIKRGEGELKKKKKKASPGLWVKLWPTSVHSAVHYYQSNYSRQVNSALIYVNPITFFPPSF